MRIAGRRTVPLIILVGLASLILARGVTDLTASRWLQQDNDRRAMSRLNGAMKVAWRIVREHGTPIRQANGHIYAGDMQIDGNSALVDEIHALIGFDVGILRGNEGLATTITAADGRRLLGENVPWRPKTDAKTDLSQPFRGTNFGGDATYYAAYDPIFGDHGDVVATLFVGINQIKYVEQAQRIHRILLVSSLVGLLLSGIVFAVLAKSLGRQLRSRERALEEINLRLDTALDSMSQGLCFFSGRGSLILANRRYAEIYHLSPDAIAPGTTIQQINALRHKAGTLAPTADELAFLHTSNARTQSCNSLVHELDDGRVIAIHIQSMPDGGWVATHEDITGRRKTEERISHMARHDALTGLSNRNFFIERMEQATALTTRGESFAVHCLDLDHFKAVNDTLGHVVGDQLLQAIAQRLHTCVREGDSIARLGGDEFAIIQLHLRQPEEAASLARRIIETVGAPYQLGDHTVQTGASVGISVAPGDGSESTQLLKQADMALYRAKADGRSTFRFFEQEMDERLQKRRAMEIDLRLAVEHQQFELYFQPMMDVQLGEVTGFEALVRWQHPLRGMISPAEFIPLAEETGLISQIGVWVLQQACLEAVGWPAHLNVAVNVSPVQFKGDRLVKAVRDALSVSGLAPQRLELEITESLLLQNTESNLATLQELHNLGTTIAMDDFGTGYSSLSYLRSFPFDKIKIDQSFVRDLSEKEDCQAIIRAITGLGRSLGMRVLAEGVETSFQLDSLREAGCQNVQGYLFSRPTPACEIAALIKQLKRQAPELAQEKAMALDACS